MEIKGWPKHLVARPIQTEILTELQTVWDDFDVFVVQAPTGIGKSVISKTILNSNWSSAYLTPTNQLLNQFTDAFPDTRTLHRLDSYSCDIWKESCAAARGHQKGFCSRNVVEGGCPAAKDLSNAKYRQGPLAANYHIFSGHKLDRKVMVIDEAHCVLPMIQDRMAIKLWKHDLHYPDSWNALKEWIKPLVRKSSSKKLQALYESLWPMPGRLPEYLVQFGSADFNGKGTEKGRPEERECLKLIPVDISKAPPILWHHNKTNKLVLLSATFNRKDVEDLGIKHFGRVCYIDCGSPISIERRPVYINPVINLSKQNLAEASEILARSILELSEGRGKGIIHAPYSQAQILRKHLTGDRFLFHTRDNKKRVYQDFLHSSNKILIASGMYEGIDLAGDLCRWQVIAKIPWLNLGDVAVRFKADNDPEWYVWQALRQVIQASGRVCRGPEDFGESFILDATFARLYSQSKKYGLVPQWFEEALLWEDNA